MSLSIHNINKKQYYFAEDLVDKNKDYFVGCKTIRKCIIKHNIEPTHTLFAKFKDNEYKIYTENYKPAGLFLSKEYVDENILNMNNYDKKKKEIKEIKTKEQEKKMEIQKKETKKLQIERKEIKTAITERPDLIELEDNEKFLDLNGNVIEVEICGERNAKNIFIRARDVAKGFEISKLNDKILDKTSDYEYDVHFKYFSDTGMSGVGMKIKKALYLTYKGLIKLLYCSRSKNADKFQDWATEKLFTLQMGEQEDKDKLAAECLGVNVKTVIDVFRTCATTIPCVYLFSLGTVKQLRKTFNLSHENDDDIVYKFGMTNDLSRRTIEHSKSLGKLENVNLELKTFVYIDVIHKSEAETDIKNFFQISNMIIKHDHYNEIVVINNSNFSFVKKQYDNISRSYGGRNKELLDIINNLKQELLKKDNELLKKDNDLLQKDNDLLKKDNELLMKDKMLVEKDNEVLRMKLQLKESK